MRDWFNGLGDQLSNLKENIVQISINLGIWFYELKESILYGIKEIFVPDVTELENQIDAMVENISSQLGVQFNTLDRLFSREVAPEDVNENYHIAGVGTLNLKFLDTKYMIQGVAYMRPYIRGFIVLLLVLFVWRQVMSLIGQDPSIAHHAQQNYEKWRDKEE